MALSTLELQIAVPAAYYVSNFVFNHAQSWNDCEMQDCGGRQGAGARENRGGIGQEAGEQGREAGSIWGREAGAEIKKTIICYLSLGIIQSKTLI